MHAAPETSSSVRWRHAKSNYGHSKNFFTCTTTPFLIPELTLVVSDTNFLMFDESMLSSTNATDAPQVDLDSLQQLDKAKTQARDPGTIEMVEAANIKLKDHLQ